MQLYSCISTDKGWGGGVGDTVATECFFTNDALKSY